jgi:hypothetical protein
MPGHYAGANLAGQTVAASQQPNSKLHTTTEQTIQALSSSAAQLASSKGKPATLGQGKQGMLLYRSRKHQNVQRINVNIRPSACNNTTFTPQQPQLLLTRVRP